MKFSKAAQLLEGVPYISNEHARQLYDFVVETRPHQVLELGFAHGTSTCYMAAAMEETGIGRVTTMDKPHTRSLQPNLEELLGRLGLGRLVDPIFCEVTYTWELMQLIERHTVDGLCHPSYDFCFIDGAHTWEADGFAFFLADKLLKPGGWMLFDDLHWRHADDPAEMEKPWIKPLPHDMKATAQVGKIFGLLVVQHPGYSDFRVEGEWGWARKIAGAPGAATVGRDVLDRIYGRPGSGGNARRLSRRVADRLLKRNPGG